MKKITQKDISNRIRTLFEPEDEQGLPKLLEFLASQQPMGGVTQPTGEEPAVETPTMPNLAGRQQLLDTNSIAAKYPYLGAR